MELLEPLGKSGNPPITLSDHLREVADYARQVVEAYRHHWERLLGRDWADKATRALVIAALAHDWGKIAVGFQRALQERSYRWEFRHEVLSAAILLASEFPDEDVKDLAIAAVLTHHRDLTDGQLCRDAGLIPLPVMEIVNQVQHKFTSKVAEMRAHWAWLGKFRTKHLELSPLKLPNHPETLPLPADYMERLRQKIESAPVLDDVKSTARLIVRGWLMASDHAVSAGVRDFKTCLPEPDLPPPRKFQIDLGSHRGHAFLEAPTGSGKTIAAVRWALCNRTGGERIFYLLPYHASIEAMAGKLEELFGSEHVGVLHARALDYAFREYFEQIGEYEAAASYAKTETELNRLAHKPIKVTTPFQLLKWLFGVPRWEIGVSEMIGGLFIFDEIHAYDAHVIALIVEMVQVLQKLGGRFLFMSATFPPFLKQLLKKALNQPATEFTLKPEDDDWSRRFLSQVRHRLHWRNEKLEELISEILQAAYAGKQVLVVANRVTQAQEIYRALKTQIGEVHLLHGRFNYRDRVEREREAIKAINAKDTKTIRVLVATQVVEVSLDISFDTLFTEIAPVDDLLQRFGRVNRRGECPDGVEVHVAKSFDAERLRYVYDLERLHTTYACAPPDGAPLTNATAIEWVRKVYRDGWTEKEQRRFDQVQAAFRRLLSELRPLMHVNEGRDEFHGLFQNFDILPQSLFQEYEEYRITKHHLLAYQLLVPVPLGTFQRLQRARRLTRTAEGLIIASIPYDDELGLLSNQVDIDACFVE